MVIVVENVVDMVNNEHIHVVLVASLRMTLVES